MKHILFIASLIMVTFSSASFAANQVRDENTVEIEWLDLIPESERARVSDETLAALDHSANVAQQALVGSVRPELNGSNVKIPGFVIPLEGDSESISEFLLVPFMVRVFTFHHHLQTRLFTSSLKKELQLKTFGISFTSQEP